MEQLENYLSGLHESISFAEREQGRGEMEARVRTVNVFKAIKDVVKDFEEQVRNETSALQQELLDAKDAGKNAPPVPSAKGKQSGSWSSPEDRIAELEAALLDVSSSKSRRPDLVSCTG